MTNVKKGVKYDEVWLRSLEQLVGVKKLDVQFIAKNWSLVAHVTRWLGLSHLRGEVEICVLLAVSSHVKAVDLVDEYRSEVQLTQLPSSFILAFTFVFNNISSSTPPLDLNDPSAMATPDPHSVRARITAAIAPWRVSLKKPPFTAVQLVVMALLTSDISLLPKDVWKWTITSFSYYQSLASDASWTMTCHRYEDCELREVHALRSELEAVFLKYDLPLIASSAETGVQGDLVHYTIPTWKGETWLNLPGYNSVDITTFPFFKLPAELRNTIYTMVFQYPLSGMYIMKSGRKCTGVRSRDLDDATGHEPWLHQERDLLATESTTVILSPLLINRQFHDEAVPIFFSTNIFYFQDHAQLSSIIVGWSEMRRKNVRTIGFEYARRRSRHDSDEKLSDTLGRLPELRTLALWFPEREWSEEKRLETWTVREWADMPCVAPLREVRGLERIKLIGCPASLQALLESEMCQPKAIGQGSC
ncbi:hypothetical protein LTS12_015657 [Elasticomyces elasticus]|nr:hypothetical protein LTS12_015657 [Elasticomyces elasticus]